MKLAWLFVCVLYLTMQEKHHSSAILPQDISDLCPYTNFCTSTTNLTIDDPTKQSCCLPCSCSVACSLTGNCCPDVEHHLESTTVYPCRDQEEIYSSYLDVTNWQEVNGLYYRIIDGCPDNAFHDPDLSESVSRCYNASEIEYLIFVTSSFSGNTYLNTHCATCNNDDANTKWTLHLVRSSYITTGMSFEERDSRILKEGGVISIPPSHDIAFGALCAGHTINTCNRTGNWDVYDKDIERQCNESTLEYFLENWKPYRNYANVYCFICNNPEGTPVLLQCEQIIYDPVEQGQKNGGMIPFSALLTVEPSMTTTSVCDVEDVLDPFLMRCTPLLCPIGKLAQHGVCSPMIDNLIGYLVSVAMEIVIDRKDNTTKIKFNDILNDVKRFMSNTINTGKIRCNRCDLYLIRETSTGGMFVTSTLVTTEACTATEIFRGLFMLYKTAKETVFLSRSQIHLTAVGIVDNSKLMASRRNVLAYQGSSMCFFAIEFSMNIIYCPSIQFSSNDLHNFAGYEQALNLIMSKSIELENGTFRMCLDEYVSILKTTQLTSGKIQHNGPNFLASFVVSALVVYYS